MTQLERESVVGQTVSSVLLAEYPAATKLGVWTNYYLVLASGLSLQVLPYGLRPVVPTPPNAQAWNGDDSHRVLGKKVAGVVTDERLYHPAWNDAELQNPPYDDVFIALNRAWLANRITCNGESVLIVEAIEELQLLGEEYFDYWSRRPVVLSSFCGDGQET